MTFVINSPQIFTGTNNYLIGKLDICFVSSNITKYLRQYLSFKNNSFANYLDELLEFFTVNKSVCRSLLKQSAYGFL